MTEGQKDASTTENNLDQTEEHQEPPTGEPTVPIRVSTVRPWVLVEVREDGRTGVMYPEDQIDLLKATTILDHAAAASRAGFLDRLRESVLVNLRDEFRSGLEDLDSKLSKTLDETGGDDDDD